MSDDQENINKETNSKETLLEFPCEFQIKVMGLDQDYFQKLVFEIISGHIPDLTEAAIKTRQSSNGKYLSVSVTIIATSKTQLDEIYMSLSDHERVLIAL